VNLIKNIVYSFNDEKYKDMKEEIKKYVMPNWLDIILTIVQLTIVTALCILFDKLGFTEANIITVYIMGVLINTLYTKSHMSSLISSFCSVLLFNYFFTEPKLTFHAYEPGYSVTFTVMLAAALLTGTLENKLKDNAKKSAMDAYRTKVLFDTNQLLQKARSTDEVMKIIANQVIFLLNKDVIIYPINNKELGNGYVFCSNDEKEEKKDIVFFEEEEKEVVKWALENLDNKKDLTNTCKKSKALYINIGINDYLYGIIGIHIDNDVIDSFEYSVLNSILGEGALALENLRNEKDKKKAAQIAQREKLRANLLRTLSHDLRTPLTSISGNASNLSSHYKQMDDETRKQIFSDIYDDSEWLINLVENLLSVTRIENGEMTLNTSVELINDVIEEAIKHLDRHSIEHEICLNLCEDMLLCNIDARLIVQVVINIINNAIKYTKKNSKIIVESGLSNDEVFVRIIDNGQGMDENTKKHAFDMFYIGQNKVADSKRSLGLGLALCKSVIEAHNGRIIIEDNKPHGCIFTFFIKQEEVVLNE